MERVKDLHIDKMVIDTILSQIIEYKLHICSVTVAVV